MMMMLLIAFDFYFYTFLLQTFFEDHQVANFQPLSTESSFAINLNITRLLCRYKVKLSVLKVKNQSVIFTFSELEKRNDDPRSFFNRRFSWILKNGICLTFNS
jgi:hypothetical protein